MTETKTYPFDEQVRAMSFRQIVEAMVRGLRAKHVAIDMGDYGGYDKATETCYGCAATNTICEISGIKFTPLTVTETQRAPAVAASRSFLDRFEIGLDSLRRGYCGEDVRAVIAFYWDNRPIVDSDLPPDIDLPPVSYKPGPELDDNYTEEDLVAWEQSVAHLPLERVR